MTGLHKHIEIETTHTKKNNPENKLLLVSINFTLQNLPQLSKQNGIQHVFKELHPQKTSMEPENHLILQGESSEPSTSMTLGSKCSKLRGSTLLGCPWK